MSAAERHWGRTFFPVWTGQAASILGSQVAQFGVVWWLTTSTGSGTVLALGTMAAVIPGVVLGPIVGALVDRWDRKVVMMSADFVSALVAAALALAAWSGDLAVWQVYLALFVRSIAGSFHFPAMQASTALMVPPNALSRIAGLNQMLMGGMNIAAAPLGALLLEVMPLAGLLMVDVATAALAIVPLLFVSIPRPLRTEARVASVIHDMREGLSYVLRWPGMTAMLGMAMMTNFLLAPAFSLMPLLVTRHFRGDAGALAILSASWWAGIVAGGLVLSASGGFKHKMQGASIALGLMGLMLLAPGLAPRESLWLAGLGLAAGGIFNALANGTMFALFQTIVAPEMLGRFIGLLGTATQLTTPLGLMIAGPLSDRWGPQPWFVLGGLACLVIGVVCFASPTMRALEKPRQAGV